MNNHSYCSKTLPLFNPGQYMDGNTWDHEMMIEKFNSHPLITKAKDKKN